MSEQLVKEELYLQIMDGLEKSCRLMAAYDEMPMNTGTVFYTRWNPTRLNGLGSRLGLLPRNCRPG